MILNYDRIIWDFNGTILDDVDVCIRSANTLLCRHGLPAIKDEESYRKIFGFPVIEYYKRLGFDFSITDYDTLAHEWVEIYLGIIEEAPIRRGIKETVSALRSLGIKQTVLSMTEHKMLHHQLDIIGIKELFDEVCGLDDIYASSKLTLAKKWREEHQNERVLYIGDTSHDADSARIIGAELFLITCGHESRQSLLASGHRVIDDPEEILLVI